MKKMFSLIKAVLSCDMNLFKVKRKSDSKIRQKLLPIILAGMLFGYVCMYANMIIEPLVEVHLEYVLLTIFVLFTSILTLMEGVYKAGSLLFNLRDDNLLFSLPIKRSTVLFIRFFKFYVFELMYNSLFLVPSMLVYIRYVDVSFSFYLVSFIMILLLPIIPIVLSCIIGFITIFISSNFKSKNIAQTIITICFILVVLYVSFNFKNILSSLATNATSINDLITKIYYPAGVYNKLILNFNAKDLILFIILNISLVVFMIIFLKNIYFKINSKIKIVKKNSNSKYEIKTQGVIQSLVKKELHKFINTPVFIINSGFGIVLFVVGCVVFSFKYDSVIAAISKVDEFQNINIGNFAPLVLFGFICAMSCMTSITSSMISLEGKSFNILKSLPIRSDIIIKSKVLTAVLLMVPFFIIGDIIVFIKLKFTLLEIVLSLVASVIMPFVVETFGIIINLKYPKMDAENDTEVVKQSMSSFVSVMTGMLSTFLIIFVLSECISRNIGINIVMTVGVIIMLIICMLLNWYIKKYSMRDFNNITV